MKTYIDDFIGTLEIVQNRSKDKINRLMETNIDIDNWSKEKILNEVNSNLESIFYISNSDISKYYRFEKAYMLGLFIYCPFQLNKNINST